MEITKLQLPTRYANVRTIDTTSIFRKKGNIKTAPMYMEMYEFSLPQFLNVEKQIFSKDEINYVANLLKQQIFQTIMTPNYNVEFQIGNYANGDVISTKKFLVKPSDDIKAEDQIEYVYELQNQSNERTANDLLSNRFYVSMYFTYKPDKPLDPRGEADNDGLCFWHCLESLYALPILKHRFGELKPVKISEIPDIESNFMGSNRNLLEPKTGFYFHFLELLEVKSISRDESALISNNFKKI